MSWITCDEIEREGQYISRWDNPNGKIKANYEFFFVWKNAQGALYVQEDNGQRIMVASMHETYWAKAIFYYFDANQITSSMRAAMDKVEKNKLIREIIE